MCDNYEIVNKGFDILHEIMSGFICMKLKKAYGDIWWNEVLNALTDQNDVRIYGTDAELMESLDRANCIRIIERKSRDFFSYHISKDVQTWCRELMSIRNKLAHRGIADIDSLDAERYLDTMVRVCEQMDKTAAEEIRDLYIEVRNSVEGDRIAVDPADLLPSQPEGPGADGELLNLIGTDAVQKTSLTRKVSFDGKTETYPVYKVRLEALYYNDQNDRIATWISRYKAENGTDAFDKLSREEYNRIIEDFIFESNPEKIKDTQRDIQLFDQKIPGVALSDGRIVDGNRRFTCLRRIERENGTECWFETAIIDADIQRDRKQIKLLELAIQHGEEEKVGYDLIDYAIGTYIDVVKTQLLTVEEYAHETKENIADVKKRIESAELISEFLEYIKLPEQYHVARDMQVYSLFQELLPVLRQLKNEKDKEALKKIAFNNAIVRAVPDQRKFVRDIKMLVKNDAYKSYFKEQEELGKKLETAIETRSISGKADADAIAQDNTVLARELNASMEKAKKRAMNQTVRMRPTEKINKCLDSLAEIDPRNFSRLNEDDKMALRKNILDLIEIANSFIAELDSVNR